MVKNLENLQLREELEKRVSVANYEKYRPLKLDEKTRWKCMVEIISDDFKVHDVGSYHPRKNSLIK